MAGLLSALAGFEDNTPSERDYALIGEIALQLTGLEYQLERLIWYYIGDIDRGHITTAQLGSEAKTRMLEVLVEWTEPDDAVAESINWMIKAFHISRVNRNSIIHGFNFTAEKVTGKLKIERRTKSLVFDQFETFEINRGVLECIVDCQSALSVYFFRVGRIIQGRPDGILGPNLPPPTEPAQLPSKPPLPESLKPLHFEAAKSTRRQRQEHSAKEAKAALRGKRGKKRRSGK